MQQDTEPVSAPARPAGTELATVVVVCCNRVEHTRQCLESVLNGTRQPYELIVVDNASTDQTSVLLEQMRGRPGPERLEVIRNASNQGFAAAVNQALRQARGRFVALLHNDVVVPRGWLGQMLKCLLHLWPQIGLVGPVSNHAGGAQQIEAAYASLDELAAFTERRFKEYRGQAGEVDRLGSFCLLTRREVLDQVGQWPDGREEADLCRLVKSAGYRPMLVQDVFVHHAGKETSPLAVNVATGGSPVAPPLLIATKNSTQRISFCMIAKNEAERLSRCLTSVADLVAEMLVVDTGSTDDSKAVAARLGARVVDFPWVDDFSAARNESIRHARGDWIFWLDGDEDLDEVNRQRLRTLFAGLRDEKAAYVMRQVSESAGGSSLAVAQVRLFRNDPAIRWDYRVHEQILLSLRRAGHRLDWTDVAIRHWGYQESTLSAAKLERNLRLLRLQQAERPDDPVTLYHLGLALGQQGRVAEAVPLLRRSLERTPPDYSTRPKLYAVLSRGLQRLGQRKEALAVCRQGQREHADEVELLFMEALLRKRPVKTTVAAPGMLRACFARPMLWRYLVCLPVDLVIRTRSVSGAPTSNVGSSVVCPSAPTAAATSWPRRPFIAGGERWPNATPTPASTRPQTLLPSSPCTSPPNLPPPRRASKSSWATADACSLGQASMPPPCVLCWLSWRRGHAPPDTTRTHFSLPGRRRLPQIV